jgi:hypothetical protein
MSPSLSCTQKCPRRIRPQDNSKCQSSLPAGPPTIKKEMVKQRGSSRSQTHPICCGYGPQACKACRTKRGGVVGGHQRQRAGAEGGRVHCGIGGGNAFSCKTTGSKPQRPHPSPLTYVADLPLGVGWTDPLKHSPIDPTTYTRPTHLAANSCMYRLLK